MGGIIVSSAGNSGRNIDSYGENGNILVPCALDNVICVGGYNNQFDEDIRNLYKKHKNSNYGSTIDIYAPYHAETVTVLNGKVNKNSISGTSLSSPLVAGMIATIMSENILNSNVKYTKETIYKELIKLGKSETITVNNKICYLANNGKHIVYSSDKKYSGCGIHAGNISCNDSENKRKDRCGPGYGSCSNNDCCSKYGWCDTTPEHCGVGCQPEYGLCTSSSSSSPEIPISAVKDRCGPNYGACAKPNTCCSKYGWCDTSSTHCGKGCQPEYGICH